jgi:hypothetical protein
MRGPVVVTIAAGAVAFIIVAALAVELSSQANRREAARAEAASVVTPPTPPAAVPPPPQPVTAPPVAADPAAKVWTAACAMCERDRVACLAAVARGELPQGAEQFADPVNSAKQFCAIDAMGCFTEANCPKR